MLSPSRALRIMPLANKPTDESDPPSSPDSSTSGKWAAQSASAIELPLVVVGAVLLGGALGFFLDRAMHTGPWLMFVFGGLGFFGGIHEVIRRTSPNR
jgi:F0F1-type ATP synthase assembly protein I